MEWREKRGDTRRVVWRSEGRKKSESTYAEVSRKGSGRGGERSKLGKEGGV